MTPLRGLLSGCCKHPRLAPGVYNNIAPPALSYTTLLAQKGKKEDCGVYPNSYTYEKDSLKHPQSSIYRHWFMTILVLFRNNQAMLEPVDYADEEDHSRGIVSDAESKRAVNVDYQRLQRFFLLTIGSTPIICSSGCSFNAAFADID